MGRLGRLGQHAADAWEVPRDLLLGRYPAFVSGGPLPSGHIPVFCLHSLEPSTFEGQLRHLSENGYRTLSADEYYQVLLKQRPAPDKAVVLTFDDGRASVRSVGLPLMRRYGMRGIVFVVPGRTRSRPGPLPPTLDDMDMDIDIDIESASESDVKSDSDAKSAGLEKLLEREQGDDAFLTWEELHDMARSGLFDFGSHSLSHARMHTHPEVVTFMHPGLARGFGPLDAPLVHDGQRDLLGAEIPLGTPLLRSWSRLSDKRRFYETSEVRQACVERVAEEGPAFFARRDWERVLRNALPRTRLTGRFESGDEQQAAILRELRDAREQIEERLGRPALDLCYPWHVGDETARRMALEVGYRTAYCGKVPGTPVTPPGGNPHAVARVGEDYVQLLPGRGRSRLSRILRDKLTRRLRQV